MVASAPLLFTTGAFVFVFYCLLAAFLEFDDRGESYFEERKFDRLLLWKKDSAFELAAAIDRNATAEQDEPTVPSTTVAAASSTEATSTVAPSSTTVASIAETTTVPVTTTASPTTTSVVTTTNSAHPTTTAAPTTTTKAPVVTTTAKPTPVHTTARPAAVTTAKAHPTTVKTAVVHTTTKARAVPRALHKAVTPKTHPILPQHKISPKPVAKRKGDIFDACKLVDHEPWDAELRSFLNVHYDPLAKCNRTFKPLTQLIEGVLDLTFGAALDGGYMCEGRCLLHITDYRYHANKWEALPLMPDCDVVETRCKRAGSTEIMYNYLHTQVKPLKSNHPKNIKPKATDKKGFKPSVYIVLFDSVADTQSIRSFNKTVSYLQHRFNSTRIRHMNKVGDNSRPNGYAFLMGEIAYTINKEIFGVPDLKGARTYEQSCNVPLDGEDKSVFARYKKAGYRTMIAEDWARGVFNYPKCIGYNHQPSDHYMRPFHLRLEEVVSPQLLKDSMGVYGCREPHMDLMEYMNKFIRAYPDDPKFGFIWMSVLSHDDPNLIFHADDYVQKFFEKNAEEFDNSFVFFMGDHGLRFGRQRNSAAGRREVNNPMLHMITPKNIRSQFEKRLEANSHELVTMFDLHATFLDIVDYQPKVNFSGNDFIRIPASTEGSSLLRSLNPTLPRNCRTLPIPFDYCPCEFDLKPVKDAFTALKMANHIVDLMNADLASFNLSDCSILSLDKRPDVVEFVPIEDTNLYKIEFSTKPGRGRFEALIRTHEPTNASSYVLASPTYNRLNAYGHDGDCITRAPQKPYCYCKSNLHRKPTVRPPLKRG